MTLLNYRKKNGLHRRNYMYVGGVMVSVLIALRQVQ